MLTGLVEQAQKTATAATQRAEADLSYQRTETNRTRDEVAKLRDEFTKQSALVVVQQAEIADLKKHRESWSQRLWQLGVGLLLALTGGVIGYLLKR